MPLVCEAAAALALASAAIAIMPFCFVTRTASWGCMRRTTPEQDRLAIEFRVCWAVKACARRVPWRAVCFQVGLAVQWMLRRRGIPSVLYYGAAMQPAGQLVAHVWVCDGEIAVVGASTAGSFAALGRFPPSGGSSLRPET